MNLTKATLTAVLKRNGTTSKGIAWIMRELRRPKQALLSQEYQDKKLFKDKVPIRT